MTKKQWLQVHARLARIYEKVDDEEIKADVNMLMLKVDMRIAAIERGASYE